MATCKNCLHNKLCEEINGLKCRSEFIWYDEEGGCPYYIESSANAVEVVRCSECDHFIPCEGSEEGYCVELQRGMPNNGFCCLAKRKEKDHE